MKRLQSSLFLRTFSICLLTTIVSTSLLSLSTPVQASLFDSLFKKKAEGNASGRSKAGATRSQCSQISDKSLMALVPQSNEGLTTKDYPQFWFYVPFGKTPQSLPVEFRLLNEKKKSVLQKPLLFSLPDKKGIVSFSLPSTEKPLVAGERYHWYFNIACFNDKGSKSNISIDGWIKRVEPDSKLVEQLKKTRPQEQYVPYAQNSIWYETFSQLAENRTTYKKEWGDILSLFTLTEFKDAPISELKLQK
jgi:Domain of Unknown Function (DUF928)